MQSFRAAMLAAFVGLVLSSGLPALGADDSATFTVPIVFALR